MHVIVGALTTYGQHVYIRRILHSSTVTGCSLRLQLHIFLNEKNRAAAAKKNRYKRSKDK